MPNANKLVRLGAKAMAAMREEFAQRAREQREYEKQAERSSAGTLWANWQSDPFVMPTGRGAASFRELTSRLFGKKKRPPK
ncbi:hypothetical protein G3578_06190 [Brevibacillus sp. SYP-B805]|uniref:hypothetical protein n=1 Tax=Brevibacillus sp. SYP-B805 TaxID=1578199 RepID=UPI0013EA9828|nr:hypothetical protein [Brevibacillus sp. SYP-B805]NGQ94773.1 hypothetical protein [Brevibacillus sp. SYP-B805]